ncbi:hypothetical protein HK100_000101 [Physocladia obscura]|uniref:GH18 domain-containing protein n=1 Tax=Physocladia obscura TaxID=109957 RepID=A0AAD5T0C2_9FUNG|nr:hypothetical protein HK100_000101 [Physocladia obscura]
MLLLLLVSLQLLHPTVASTITANSIEYKTSTTATLTSVTYPYSTSYQSASIVGHTFSSKSKSAAATTTTSIPTITITPLAPNANASAPECYPNYTDSPFASLPYNTADLVSYGGRNFHVVYQGAVGPPSAVSGSGWVDEGLCNGDGFTYRPFTIPGIIGYWTNWSGYSRAQNAIDMINLNAFTAINYAFDATGTLESVDPNADLNWLRKFTAQRYKNPNLKAIATIGGWSDSTTFSTIAASPLITASFVKNIHLFLDTMGFDGIDLDFEYPGGVGAVPCNAHGPQDAANFATLLAQLRVELGPTRTISIAVSGEVSHYAVGAINYIPEYVKSASYIQIMSYDFYGSWSPYSDFNSPLNAPVSPTDPTQPALNNVGFSESLSHASVVTAWTESGCPLDQMVTGIAFYGRSWQIAAQSPAVQAPTNNGLYQHCYTAGSNNNISEACPGIIGDFLDESLYTDVCGSSYHSSVWMYMNLRGAVNLPTGSQQPNAPLSAGPIIAANGWTREYFEFAESPTLFSEDGSGGGVFISYDDIVSVRAKAAFAKGKGLGGVMIWEISQDFQGELVQAVTGGWEA